MHLPTFSRLWLACENPVLGRELRERMRGARSYGITGAYTAAICAWVFLLYTGLNHLFRDLPPPQAAPLLGEGIWTWGCVLQGFLLPLAMPALTAGAITYEREREMLELLLLTHQSPVRICLGKLFSGVGLGLTLLAASVPPLCLCLFLGGVTPEEMAASLCVLASAVVMAGAVGLAASTVARTTSIAATFSYLTLGFVIVGMPLILGFIANAPRHSAASDAEIAAMIAACFAATFAPAVGLAALLLALSRRRRPNAAAPLPRSRWLLVGGLTWCALSTIVSHPGMTELMQSGRSLLLFHPGTAVLARMSAPSFAPAPARAVVSLRYYNSQNLYAYYPYDPGPSASALEALQDRLLGISYSTVNTQAATFPGSKQLRSGLEIVVDVLWTSAWIVPHLWWMGSLLYLSVGAWCFLIAVVRVRRMRSDS